MNYKVWRRKINNSVVGFCEASYDGFEPGGDLSTYAVTTEKNIPTFPTAPPTLAQTKMATMLNDPAVPQTVKDYLATL